ncbi:hypothetical protein BCR42DRAFT_427222 [Absidia repens]|uniref:Uncharacterized protein n=1 Tax=Absidia repens TaxID=90262 RepID=A0A1X2I0G9_9FUNG|nr:hypothetical protein BCR42DRAFT_427222 [Absidia repens]
MSLQSMMGTLTQRFRSNAVPSLMWMRSMSTSSNNAANNKTTSSSASASPTLPSILANSFQEPKELSTSLDAYAGRSIGNVSNVNSAYRRLSIILAQNNVRREIRANMNYEKPNVARRRKNIERNRKLFGAMVRKKVALIMQMKQRGM